jgi:hypothetical protein
MRHTLITRLGPLTPLVLLLACDAVPSDVPPAPNPSIAAQLSSAGWSEWSEPVNLGAPVNSAFTEQNSALSKDGLTLYIQSNRPGGLGGNDLWVSHRASLESPWEAPVHLGNILNTAGAEGGPWLSNDEHLLFFHSDRPGGMGDRDIWVSQRRDKHDDFGWETPVNLGPLVNTAGAELSPAVVEVGSGGHTLYFQRGPQGLSGVDIYQVTISGDGVPLGAGEIVAELSVPGANDASPNPSKDGREIIFASTRLGGGGGLFVSTRRSVNDPWEEPVSLGGSLSAAANGPKVSRDGRTMMFFSTRAGGVGGFDIWMTTRTRDEN